VEVVSIDTPQVAVTTATVVARAAAEVIVVLERIAVLTTDTQVVTLGAMTVVQEMAMAAAAKQQLHLQQANPMLVVEASTIAVIIGLRANEAPC
jgi:hypothetical protein